VILDSKGIFSKIAPTGAGKKKAGILGVKCFVYTFQDMVVDVQ